MTELEKSLRLNGEMLAAQHEQEKRLLILQGENRKLVADYGARGDLLAEALEQIAEIDRQVDVLGEALYLMSGPLAASGFLADEENHRLYENVVSAFREIGWKDDPLEARLSTLSNRERGI